jgi:hypothetical protein
VRARLARLSLLAAAALAIFLWRGGANLFPAERSITWPLWGDFATIRRVEGELLDGQQVLLKLELSTPRGVTFEPVSSAPLRAGTYRTHVAIWRGDAGEPEVKSGTFAVE